jgi:hypothetical protein
VNSVCAHLGAVDFVAGAAHRGDPSGPALLRPGASRAPRDRLVISVMVGRN